MSEGLCWVFKVCVYAWAQCRMAQAMCVQLSMPACDWGLAYSVVSQISPWSTSSAQAVWFPAVMPINIWTLAPNSMDSGTCCVVSLPCTAVVLL